MSLLVMQDREKAGAVLHFVGEGELGQGGCQQLGAGKCQVSKFPCQKNQHNELLNV